MTNIYLIFILTVLVSQYFLDLIVETLNVRNLSTDLPKDFEGFYDSEKYRKSQEYLRDNTKFELIQKTVMTPITITFLVLGGFNFTDQFARSYGGGSIQTGLIFVATLTLLSSVVSLPFSLYRTFVIEEKYGFNKTTIKTFFLDKLKGLVLGGILGGAIFSGLIWFFESTGERAWIYSWIAVISIQLIIMYVAPIVIMPLFNKFTPLENGDLKSEIEKFAASQNFKLSGIFKMDGSRRSTKANAFFTGFGRFRRIVLFDTLIENQTVSELTAVLAHEIGHFKMKHIHKTLVISILSTGLLFFILSLFIDNENLFLAFRMDNVSVYASLVFIAFLYSPISLLLSILSHALSRKHEFEADEYSSKTYGRPGDLITALKKLSVDTLSNLSPHPLKVVMDYTHPPVLERVKALRGQSS